MVLRVAVNRPYPSSMRYPFAKRKLLHSACSWVPWISRKITGWNSVRTLLAPSKTSNSAPSTSIFMMSGGRKRRFSVDTAVESC